MKTLHFLIIIVFGGNSLLGQTQVSADSLFEHVSTLTLGANARVYNNAKGLKSARDYVHHVMSKYTENVELEAYSAYGNEYHNVVCHFGPDDGERIVIGAHYDVCGDMPGADDNASGVAGLLELARVLSEREDLSHRIDLVAYTLEEPPFFATQNMGSFHHAQRLHEAGVKVKYMLSLEMIGYFTEAKKSQEFPIRAMRFVYPTTGNFIAVIGKSDQNGLSQIAEGMERNCKVPVEFFSGPETLEGVGFSDHRNYWQFGYRAFMVTDTSFYRNPNYHKSTDKIDTLDFKKMREVVAGVAGLLTRT